MTYEYKVISEYEIDELPELGKAGWRLSHIIQPNKYSSAQLILERKERDDDYDDDPYY